MCSTCTNTVCRMLIVVCQIFVWSAFCNGILERYATNFHCVRCPVEFCLPPALLSGAQMANQSINQSKHISIAPYVASESEANLARGGFPFSPQSKNGKRLGDMLCSQFLIEKTTAQLFRVARAPTAQVFGHLRPDICSSGHLTFEHLPRRTFASCTFTLASHYSTSMGRTEGIIDLENSSSLILKNVYKNKFQNQNTYKGSKTEVRLW